jgi:glutathione peroxidase-family protein
MKKLFFGVLLLSVVALMGACNRQSASDAAAATQTDTDNIYQFSVLNQTGDTVALGDYKGKVLLLVNSATQCGFTPQYEELQALYAKYKDKGFEIIDFPCNQFGEQAPGTNEEIHGFCSLNYGITFAQMDKIDVNGPNAIPLYSWLKEKAPFGGFDLNDPRGAYLNEMFLKQDSLYAQNPDIKWNFTKFLIDKEGNVLSRFEPTDSISKVDAAVAAALK